MEFMCFRIEASLDEDAKGILNAVWNEKQFRELDRLDTIDLSALKDHYTITSRQAGKSKWIISIEDNYTGWIAAQCEISLNDIQNGRMDIGNIEIVMG
ncbi:hypothetical protein [Bacillus sp. MUM 13]|uniref:hypothetical protein n=1 Tax=Bacillus sp. MUM 13 TaxID=1678001 RepID=UPI0008F55935|nr:hypothetical protein [Bacillus sp. MUM 13]OIK14880.1 hypothetical protein BIV59_01485 [Bacillus sp. MUM 13]